MPRINSRKLPDIQFDYEQTQPEGYTFSREPETGWYEIFYLKTGRVHFVLGESRSFLLPGDSLLLIPPKINCRSFAAGEESLEYLRIQFHGTLLAAERQKPLSGLFDENYIGQECFYSEIGESRLDAFLKCFMTEETREDFLLQMWYALLVEAILTYLYAYDLHDKNPPPRIFQIFP